MVGTCLCFFLWSKEGFAQKLYYVSLERAIPMFDCSHRSVVVRVGFVFFLKQNPCAGVQIPMVAREMCKGCCKKSASDYRVDLIWQRRMRFKKKKIFWTKDSAVELKYKQKHLKVGHWFIRIESIIDFQRTVMIRDVLIYNSIYCIFSWISKNWDQMQSN